LAYCACFAQPTFEPTRGPTADGLDRAANFRGDPCANALRHLFEMLLHEGACAARPRECNRGGRR